MHLKNLLNGLFQREHIKGIKVNNEYKLYKYTLKIIRSVFFILIVFKSISNLMYIIFIEIKINFKLIYSILHKIYLKIVIIIYINSKLIK